MALAVFLFTSAGAAAESLEVTESSQQPLVRLMGAPLTPLGEPSIEETGALLRLTERIDPVVLRKAPDAFDPYLQRHGSGPWSAALLANLGSFYRRNGFFTRAGDTWSEAWALLRNDPRQEARLMAGEVVGNLIELTAALGRLETLRGLVAEAESLGLTGHAREQLSGARLAVWMMSNDPGSSFRCGPIALQELVRTAFEDPDVRREKLDGLDLYPSTPRGTSLAMLHRLARERDLEAVVVRRARGSDLPIPSVTHWRSGHFAAVTAEREGFLEVIDPTFGHPLWIPVEAFEEESSGYHMLLGSESLPAGWTKIELAEAAGIWGKGNTGNPDPGATTPDDPKIPDDCQPGLIPSHPPTQPSIPMMPSHEVGMPRYDMHLGLVSLNITDTPILYVPPRDPAIPFTLTYNSREAYQPTTFSFSNVGERWTTNWIAYTEDDATVGADTVRLAERGGGSYFYTFDSSTNGYKPNRRGPRDALIQISGGFLRRYPDGSEERYTVWDGVSLAQRRLFLSKVTDRFGNSVTLEYDSEFRARLMAIRDSQGRAVTLEYGMAGDPYRITTVTDPFGRSAHFGYTAGRLSSITDMGGFTSTLTYGPTAQDPALPADFISSFETPYGITRFRMGESGVTRWLEALDPAGARKRIEFRHEAPGIASSTNEPVPKGFAFNNAFLQYRNTFYWSQRAMQQYRDDDADRYRKATVIFHWLHNGTGATALASTEPESMKIQGQRRVWYSYPGQPGSIQQGSLASPRVVARVLQDGSEERVEIEYSPRGTPLSFTDAMGRRTRYHWANGERDLVQIDSESDVAKPERLMRVEYEDHRPVRVVSVAGDEVTISYNGFAQPVVLTFSDGTSMNAVYDASGRLIELNRSGVSKYLFTWDPLDRLATWTDPEGFQLRFEYDEFDRATRLLYPDGTSETWVYDRFDLVEYRSRLGEVTSITYDALGRPIAVQDPDGAVTRFEWCGCRDLERLIDPRGNVSEWRRDPLGRVVARLINGRVTGELTYDSAGRIVSRKDAAGQIKRIEHHPDGRLRRISYPNAIRPTPDVEYFWGERYTRLERMIDRFGVTNYSYHPVGTPGGGQVATIDGPFNNDVITWEYDIVGRVTRQTINGVESVQQYDALGRLASRRNALGTFVPTYEGTTGEVTRIDYPNGQWLTFDRYGPQQFHNLAGMTSSVMRSGVEQRLTSIGFGYQLPDGSFSTDAITKMSLTTNDPGSGRTLRFGYDPIQQVISRTVETNGLLTSLARFGYDLGGNRISEEIDGIVSTAVYDDENQLIEIQRRLDQHVVDELEENRRKAKRLVPPPPRDIEREGRDQ